MYDFGVEEDRGHPYMVMEYAPGVSLADWIHQQPPPSLERIVFVCEQILSALDHAHDLGVIHRDLKPENVIVTRAGNVEDFVKLLDFGIARMTHEGATRGLTQEGEIFGTPHYMSPEQAQGSRDVGPQADVYAFGIMMYEMLCQRCPFDAPAPLAVLMMHINDPLPPIKLANGAPLSLELERILRRATAKEPAARYADAGEFLVALQSVAVAEGTSSHSGLYSRSRALAAAAAYASHGGAPPRDSGPATGVLDPSPAAPPAGPVAVADPDPSGRYSHEDLGHVTGLGAPRGSSRTAGLAAIAVAMIVILGLGLALVLSGGENAAAGPAAPQGAAVMTKPVTAPPTAAAQQEPEVEELVAEELLPKDESSAPSMASGTLGAAAEIDAPVSAKEPIKPPVVPREVVDEEVQAPPRAPKTAEAPSTSKRRAAPKKSQPIRSDDASPVVKSSPKKKGEGGSEPVRFDTLPRKWGQ